MLNANAFQVTKFNMNIFITLISIETRRISKQFTIYHCHDNTQQSGITYSKNLPFFRAILGWSTRGQDYKLKKVR